MDFANHFDNIYNAPPTEYMIIKAIERGNQKQFISIPFDFQASIYAIREQWKKKNNWIVFCWSLVFVAERRKKNIIN